MEAATTTHAMTLAQRRYAPIESGDVTVRWDDRDGAVEFLGKATNWFKDLALTTIHDPETDTIRGWCVEIRPTQGITDAFSGGELENLAALAEESGATMRLECAGGPAHEMVARFL